MSTGGLEVEVNALLLKNYTRGLVVCNTCRCGFCRDLCPVYRVYRVESAAPHGRMQIAQAFTEDFVPASEKLLERISLCTTCGYCTERCPSNYIPAKFDVRVDPTATTEAFRADIINAGVTLPPYRDILNSIDKNYNPLWESHEKRRKWLLPIGVKPQEKADTLYYAGCMASYRTLDIAEATVKILANAEIPFTMLQDERCCGSPLLRTGYRDAAKKRAQELVSRIEASGAERVVTSCAGCFRTLKIDYPQIVGKLPFEVLHITELLKELISEKKLNTERFKKTVTWHDPCHLGRHAKVYEAPREVVAAYAPLVEMEWNKEYSHCCGAGGGFRKSWRDLSIAITQERIQEAKEVGAEVLVTCCPFCTFNFKEAGGIEMYDLPVFIAKVLKIM